MIKISYKKWEDVSISLYDSIAKIAEDKAMDDLEKDIALIALLSDVEEEKVWELKPQEVRALKEDMLWLNSFDFDKKKKYSKIKIGDITAKAIDISDMTMSQYVDFQNYYSQIGKNVNMIANLISVFFVPQGKKYNDGYDIAEFIDLIRKNISITDGNSIVFFMLRKYLKSIASTLRSLEVKMVVMEKMLPMTRLEKDEMKRARKEVKVLRSTLTSAL